MNQRTRGALAALAAVAAFASGASAEGTAGKGSVGGILGVPYFTADADTKDGQRPRILGQMMFQYAFSSRTRLATSFGYGWVGYKAGTIGPYKVIQSGTGDSTYLKDEMLTKFQPISVSILRSFKDQGSSWVPYLGAGVNLTRIEIVNDRRKIKDPATFDSYVNFAPGVQAQGGFEYFLASNSNVSFDFSARYAKLFSKDEEKFPSGFTGPHSYVAVNFGVNVYFWPIGHKPIETAKDPQPDAPAPAEAPAELAPTPPPTPETPASPDTTKAPGEESPKAAPLVEPVVKIVAPAVICPAPRPSEATSGMFGIPGAPVAPPRREDAPPMDLPAHDTRTEDGPTP